MTVFLRWGALALLLFSAIFYAYRVNQRAPEIAAALEAQEMARNSGALVSEENSREPVTPDELPAACNGIATAIDAGRNAAEAREPLDRALRQSFIAFESDLRRKAAMETAATRAYDDARAGRNRDADIAAGACAPLLQEPAEPAADAETN